MVFISLLSSQKEIKNPLLLFHLLVDTIFVAVFINLLLDEWDMYSLMFHENLPKLNLGHFWPRSLSLWPGLHQGTRVFIASLLITLFMSVKCFAPYLTLPLVSVFNFPRLAVWHCLVGVCRVCHGYFSVVLGFTNRSHIFPPRSPLLMSCTLVLSVQLAIFLKGD